IPSLVLGLQPNRVRGRVVGWSLRIDPRYVLLAERFESAGYDTAGFLCCDGFWGSEFHTGLSRGIQHMELEHDGNKLSELGRKWIAAREATHPQKPLFVWMHLIEPHNWLENQFAPRDDADRKRIYNLSLTASDWMAQQLVSAFSHRAPEDM